jgi:hypothetical protein
MTEGSERPHVVPCTPTWCRLVLSVLIISGGVALASWGQVREGRCLDGYAQTLSGVSTCGQQAPVLQQEEGWMDGW